MVSFTGGHVNAALDCDVAAALDIDPVGVVRASCPLFAMILVVSACLVGQVVPLA